MRDKSYQTYPFQKRRAQKLVTLDGKLYTYQEYLKQLCVLDLAAGGCQWKPCGGYHELLKWYEFGVMDGKLYAFTASGLVSGPSTFGLEVFDPQQKIWSLKHFTKLRPWRRHFQVARVGNEFVVYGELYWEVLDFYHPRKDEWRVMKSFRRPEEEFFIANDRFYSMSQSDIHVYDVQGNSWAHLHSISLPAFNPSVEPATLQVDCVRVTLVTVVDNELLAHWKWFEEPRSGQWRSYLVQSRGFASQSEQLVWEKADFSFSHDQQLLLSTKLQVESIQL